MIFVFDTSSLREVERYHEEDRLGEWARTHAELFPAPEETEGRHLTQIFAVPHFQGLIGKRAILQGTPAADPFVIAKAWAIGGMVVTEEAHKHNAAKIPNVCELDPLPVFLSLMSESLNSDAVGSGPHRCCESERLPVPERPNALGG